ncbi:MAG: nucleotidyl transferase AbiEii/AbiGii toxin family protein [Candidatus Aenigmarchaeota archaeon]|nr:nucleotidyl transferase AbiEii/AbiGii toxin family protein [Candidatus Aenigmarchaeota archaeon]
MEMISEDKLRYIAGEMNLNLIYIEKDYFLTHLLYLIREVEGIYFKGGTALNKIFLNHKRLSEDLDFATDRSVNDIRDEIESLVKKVGFFTRIETDKTTAEFVRYKVYYKSYFQKESFIILDINKKASIHLKPEVHEVPNFYGVSFSVNTLNLKELIAEKVRALITRNQPRDYFDVYYISKKWDIDMNLVEIKTGEAEELFDVERVFRNAQKIHSKWKDDIDPLTNDKLDFLECIKTLEKLLRKKG